MLRLEFLAELLERNRPAAQAVVAEFSVGGHSFRFNAEPAIMGVINLSPDSWYRESVCLNSDAAIRRGKILSAQGAAIVDVGAESTLAHAARVAELKQNEQLLPIVRGLRKAGILVSIETYLPEVAKAALLAGANIVNLTGSTETEPIYRAAAEHEAAVIICYVQGENVREVGEFDFGSDPIALMREYFARQIETAQKCGLHKIILDPGLGFYYRNLQDSAARVRHQMTTFLNTFRLRSLGYPICHALPHGFEYFGEEVRSAEPFFAVLAALGKTDLFRTHEVPKTRAVLETLRQF